MSTQGLIDKITALPAERIAEIEDFVDFIHLRPTEALGRSLVERLWAGRWGYCRSEPLSAAAGRRRCR